MAGDINKVVLIGRLTRDPEMRYTQNGTAMATFSIANNRVYSVSGEKKEMVSFFNCVVWARAAETIVQYCKKGQRIGIDGRLQQRSWDDKDGNKRSTVEVVVDNFQFLSGGRSGGGEEETSSDSSPADSGYSSNNAPEMETNPFSDDDIPF